MESTKKTPVKRTKKVKEVENTTPSFMDQFVFIDKTEKVLELSLMTNKNVILHGKGGFGKSEYTMAFLEDKGINPYVITMGSGMTTDRLFGGVDLMLFNETGKIEYLVENSFMNYEYVIFEELFDAPDFILEQLKDILSSGVFRNGGQVFPIKTKNIICCTNKTREEFAKNLSLRALLERFPLELEVKWENYNRITYDTLFEAKFGKGNTNPLLSYILEEFARKGTTISPRIALTAFQILDVYGIEGLEFIAEFKAKNDVLKDALLKFKSIAEVNEKVNNIKILKNSFVEGLKTVSSEEDKKALTSTLDKFSKTVTELSKLKLDDSMAVSTAKQIEEFKKELASMRKQLNVTTLLNDLDAELE